MSRAKQFEVFLRHVRKREAFRRRLRKRRNQSEKETGMVDERTRSKKHFIEPVVAAAPPHENWLLIVKRQFNAAGKTFPVGSTITVAQCGGNFQQMLDCHFIAWSPPADVKRPQPRDLPKPTPARTRPSVEIIAADDIVESWRATKKRMVTLCGGDQYYAMDLLMAHEGASRLFLAAQRTACERERTTR